jgi:hypothetical protein
MSIGFENSSISQSRLTDHVAITGIFCLYNCPKDYDSGVEAYDPARDWKIAAHLHTERGSLAYVSGAQDAWYRACGSLHSVTAGRVVDGCGISNLLITYRRQADIAAAVTWYELG